MLKVLTKTATRRLYTFDFNVTYTNNQIKCFFYISCYPAVLCRDSRLRVDVNSCLHTRRQGGLVIYSSHFLLIASVIIRGEKSISSQRVMAKFVGQNWPGITDLCVGHAQRWSNVGPTSLTLVQHWPSAGSSLVARVTPLYPRMAAKHYDVCGFWAPYAKTHGAVELVSSYAETFLWKTLFSWIAKSAHSCVMH